MKLSHVKLLLFTIDEKTLQLPKKLEKLMLYKDVYNIVLSYLNIDNVFHSAIDCHRVIPYKTIGSHGSHAINAFHYLLNCKLCECRLKHPLREELENTCYDCLLHDLQQNNIYIQDDYSYLDTYYSNCNRTKLETCRPVYDTYAEGTFNFTPFKHVVCDIHRHTCSICHVYKHLLNDTRARTMHSLIISLKYTYEIWFTTVQKMFERQQWRPNEKKKQQDLS